MKKLIIVILIFSSILFAQNADTIYVACIGNSITESSDRDTDYPKELQKLLNDLGNYQVENFGVSGRTLLKNGDYPIWEETKFKDAIKFNPGIITILLGTNDSKPQNWNDYSDEFLPDFIKMIDTLRSFDNNSQFIIGFPPPAFSSAWGINDTIIHDEIIPLIQKVADSTGVALCDFYTPMINDSALFPDGIHPDEEGLAKMAQILYDAILELPAMVDTIPPYFTELPENDQVFYDSVNVDIQLETSQYAEVKYSTQNVGFDEMEFTFEQTGKKTHNTLFVGEHGKEFTLYFRAKDRAGNIMDTPATFSFSIDTTKTSSRWFVPDYDTDDWNIGTSSFGFGAEKSYNLELDRSQTVYFRRIFNVEDASSILGFGLMVQAIGGAKIYLNGHEILMENLNEEEDITYDSRAVSAAYYQKVLTIDENSGFNYVQSGENLLAVELHAAKSDYSELFFNAQMFDSKNQIIFPLNSEWQYYSNQQEPENQIIDKQDVSIGESEVIITKEFILEQNYPNPFNPTTIIKYSVPFQTQIALKVFDLSGREVATLVEEKQHAGNYSVIFDGKQFASGTYLYQLKSENFVQTQKLVLLK